MKYSVTDLRYRSSMNVSPAPASTPRISDPVAYPKTFLSD